MGIQARGLSSNWTESRSREVAVPSGRLICLSQHRLAVGPINRPYFYERVSSPLKSLSIDLYSDFDSLSINAPRLL